VIVITPPSACDLDNHYMTDLGNGTGTSTDSKAVGDYVYLVIERIVQINNPDSGKAGDYYPRVYMNGYNYGGSTTDNTVDISPYWIMKYRTTSTNSFPVTIAIYDRDSHNDDDLCDANPASGTREVYLTYNPQSGYFSGTTSGYRNRTTRITGDGDSRKIHLWFRFVQSSSGSLNLSPDTHPSNHDYLGQYPDERENSLAHNLQGVTHDDDNWFFVKQYGDNLKPEFWKVPVTYDLNDVTSYDEAGGILRVRPDLDEIGGLDHFGDISYYNGHIFVPAYKKGTDNSSILVFRGSDLEYVGRQEITFTGLRGDNTKEYPRLSYVAINSYGYLYVSHKEISKDNPLLVYKIDDNSLARGVVKINYRYFVYIRDELYEYMRINHMQGGAISPDNKYIYINSGYLEDDIPHDGINVFDVNTGLRVARSTQGYGNFNYQFHPNVRWEEPEGLTFWDLNDGRAPGITGTLHILLLDNEVHDDWYFKHYTDGSMLYNFPIPVV
jgi:hypothetical protein